MPTISYDAQSLTLDSRRAWLVSGSIHYARVPRELWAERIAAARQAGLNCIDTFVFWNIHEPQPGKFHFEGDADLAHFVTLVGQAGMQCILRPGPYIGANWDNGGLPAWLTQDPQTLLRQNSPAMLEASARYFGAVMEQVRHLQVTAPRPAGKPSGPIVLMQIEHQWYCHNPQQAERYLGELVRYLRENGCNVPISAANNLWQPVDGTIETWSANQQLLQDLRQLRVIQPSAPRLVSDFQVSTADHWGRPPAAKATAQQIIWGLAEILAAGAQYNLSLFHGGTNFGFHAGRSIGARDSFVTTSHDGGSPLSEAGQVTDAYLAVKRISTFAHHFGSVLAHLHPDDPHATLAPDPQGESVSIIHQTGTQGSVVFILRGQKQQAPHVDLLLADGVTLAVPMGTDQVAWVLRDVNLSGKAVLSWTNLRPWAWIGRRMLVLFGPPGSSGEVGINGAPLMVKVPTDQQPVVEQHEGVTVVVLNSMQVDAAWPVGRELIVGAESLDAKNQPRPLKGWPELLRIDTQGNIKRESIKPMRKPAAVHPGDWQQAPLDSLIDASSELYQPIDAPASLEALGQSCGYGWYRLSFKTSRQANLLFPQAGHRLHVFGKGQRQAVLGLGPGAVDGPTKLRLGRDMVVLAENLGRFSGGWGLGEQTGLPGHGYVVKPAALGRPQVATGRLPDPFELSGYWTFLRQDERPMGDVLSWSIKPAARKPMILAIDDLPARAMVLVNETLIGMYDPILTGGRGRWVLDPQQEDTPLTARENTLQLALFEAYDVVKADLRQHVQLYQATDEVTAKAQWAFAPWTLPGEQQFQPLSDPAQQQDLPCWYRCQFEVKSTDQPLWLELPAMSKGQIYLNGRHVGRYFATTKPGQPVEPQQRYLLPAPWLTTHQPNELMLFDEHGRRPDRCQFVYTQRAT